MCTRTGNFNKQEINHLVVCKVGKEETKATHQFHTYRGQHHSRSEYYPKSSPKTIFKHHTRRLTQSNIEYTHKP